MQSNLRKVDRKQLANSDFGREILFSNTFSHQNQV